ncbi:hypothetical protein ZWY2020_047186 [Hordeum vulgare]|nr:hypothetical protein ZWY2020_047186 [Hordeum vulgare]
MSSAIMSRSLEGTAIDIARRWRPAAGLAGCCCSEASAPAAAGFRCSPTPSAGTSSRLAKFSGRENTLCDALLWCLPGLCDIFKSQKTTEDEETCLPG